MSKKYKGPIASREKLIERYRKTLEDYTFNSINRCNQNNHGQIERMMIEYPYDTFISYIDGICFRYRVYNNNNYLWDECHSCSYTAYWYGICRSVVLKIEGEHARNYIRKVIRAHIKGKIAQYILENGHVSWNDIVEKEYNED